MRTQLCVALHIMPPSLFHSIDVINNVIAIRLPRTVLRRHLTNSSSNNIFFFSHAQIYFKTNIHFDYKAQDDQAFLFYTSLGIIIGRSKVGTLCTYVKWICIKRLSSSSLIGQVHVHVKGHAGHNHSRNGWIPQVFKSRLKVINFPIGHHGMTSHLICIH